jgi:hypothetical protein
MASLHHAWLLVFVIGCTRSYPCAETTDDSIGTVAGSTTHLVEGPGGEVAEVETYAFTSSASVQIADASGTGVTALGTCAEVDLYGTSNKGDGIAVVVGFDCVSKPGSYRLEDLHATACTLTEDPRGGGENCGPVAGTLVVSAFERPCGAEGGCGALDADVTITSAATDTVTVNGQLTLAYAETVLECHEPVVTWPGGG